MANLIYRSTSADPGRGASSVKNLPLTNAEVDGNFKVVDVALGLLAPLASPTFTGTPTLPTGTVATTQIVGNDTTAVATTAFVNAEIANDAPTKTGGGASGSWGINVTGTSANVTGTVAVANGGTGLTVVGTSGNILTSNGTSWVSSTPSIAGTVTVAQGGTGQTTLTTNAVLVGNGTSAIGAVAPSTSGNILTSNGTSWVSSAPTGSGATLSNDNSTDVTQYIGMSRITAGAWTAAYAASTKLYFNPSTGTLNSTEFNSLSDANKKKNITTIVGATETIKRLRGVEFDWLENDKTSSGVIAQEIETVLPYLVSTSEIGDKSVNYSGIIGFLIESIKELNARIIVLENK